jgi:hypothetical protein
LYRRTQEPRLRLSITLPVADRVRAVASAMPTLPSKEPPLLPRLSTPSTSDARIRSSFSLDILRFVFEIGGECSLEANFLQGGQIMDNAYCGGGDSNEGLSDTSIPISEAAQKMIAAAILQGDPRHIPGLSYNVGTCQASGVRSQVLAILCFTNYSILVCPPPERIQVPIRGEHPVVLRLPGSILLQRQRFQCSPTIRQ